MAALTVADQVRAALRKTASDAGADHAEKVALYRLADTISEAAARKLWSLIR